jgi:hypothetical protein
MTKGTDAPSWMGEDYTSSPRPLTPPAAAAARIDAIVAPSPRPQVGEERVKLFWSFRVMNFLAGALLIIVAFFTLLRFPNPEQLVLGLYSGFFGLIIMAAEISWPAAVRSFVASNFGFLFSNGLRFVFYILIGFVAFFLPGVPYIGMAAWCAYVFWGLACYNVYVLWMCPEHKAIRDRITAEEDLKMQRKLAAANARSRPVLAAAAIAANKSAFQI